MLTQLAKLDLLVIDDFAISPIGASERNDLLEVLDDRVGTRATLITSQLLVKAWHTYLDDPTLADAILDRVVHSSHRIDLKGRRCATRRRRSEFHRAFTCTWAWQAQRLLCCVSRSSPKGKAAVQTVVTARALSLRLSCRPWLFMAGRLEPLVGWRMA